MLGKLSLEPSEFAEFVNAVKKDPEIRKVLGLPEKTTREQASSEKADNLKELLISAGSRFPIVRLKSAEIKPVLGKMKELNGYSAIVKYIDRVGETKQMKQDFTRQKLNSGTPAEWQKMAINARLELLRIIK